MEELQKRIDALQSRQLALRAIMASSDERAAVFDNRSTTEVVVHLVNSRLEEQHLHIAGTGQACTPTTIEALLIFCVDGILDTFGSILAAPGGAERRIFQHKTHLSAPKSVGFHGVLIADVFGVLPLDEHLGKAHGIRLRVDLLSEQAHIGRGVITFDAIVAGGKHTARATGLIQNGDNLAVIEDIIAALGKQDIDHQLNDVAAGVVVAGFGIFRELTDQFFENISHLHIVDSSRVKIKLGERLDDGEQPVVLVHFVNFFTEI